MTPLTPAQLDLLRRDGGRTPAPALAERLGAPLRAVTEALAGLPAAAPPAWHGREPRWLAVAVALVVLVVGSVAYGNNDRCGWHYDDTHALVDNPAIRVLHKRTRAATREGDGLGRRLGAVSKALGPSAQAIYDFNRYRMVTYWSFALTYFDHPLEVEGPDALPGWHDANDRIHLVNGLLVLWLGWLTLTAPVFRRARAAVPWPVLVSGLAAVVFVSHPLQVQAVTYLVQRTESLCATFYLLALALHAAARHREHGPRVGRAPWRTGLAVGAGGVVLVLAAVLATTEALQLGGLVRLGGLVAAATVAGVVVLVRRGDDEPVHAACVVGSFVAFALALETKEIGATVPFAVVAWDLLFVPAAAPAAPAAASPAAASPAAASPARRALLRAWLARVLRRDLPTRARDLGPWAAIVGGVALLAAVFGWSVIRTQLLAEGVTVGGGGELREKITAGRYLLTEQSVLLTYGRLFLLPYGQHLDWDYPVAQGSLGDGATWLALLSGAGVLAAVALAALHGGRARVAAFALALALLVLAPTSSVIVLPDPLYEHRAYLPLAGAALLLAVAAERAARHLLPEARRPWALAGLGLLLAAGLVPLARARNAAFTDEVTLWRDGTEKAPGKPRSWTNLGLALQNLEPAVITHRGGRVAGRPLKLPDGSIAVHVSVVRGSHTPDSLLGVIAPADLVRIEPTGGGPEAALAAFERALALDPHYPRCLNNVGIVHVALSRIELRQRDLLLELAAAARSRGAVALAEACEVEARTRQEEARRQAQLADDAYAKILAPDAQNLNNQAANQAMGLGDLPRAIATLRRAMDLPGLPPTSLVTLADMLRLQGVEAYEAAAARGAANPIASAAPAWSESIALLERYLSSGHTTFDDQARQRRDEVRGYLSGRVRPGPRQGGPGPGPPR